jgi:biotin carboxyl carrier protein
MTVVRAEITANVWQVRTEVGAAVAEDDELVILESMKMEIPVVAPSAGTVVEIRVAPGDNVQEGDVIVVLDP